MEPTVNRTTLLAARMLIEAANPGEQNAGIRTAATKAADRLLRVPWSVDDDMLQLASWETPGLQHHVGPKGCDESCKARTFCWHRAAYLLLQTIAGAVHGPLINGDGTMGGIVPEVEDVDWNILDTPPPTGPSLQHDPTTAIEATEPAHHPGPAIFDTNGDIIVPDRPRRRAQTAPDAPNDPGVINNTDPAEIAPQKPVQQANEEEAAPPIAIAVRKVAGTRYSMTDAQLAKISQIAQERRVTLTPEQIAAAADDIFGDTEGAHYISPRS